MKVVAKETIYYNKVVIEKGESFELINDRHFTETVMEKFTGKKLKDKPKEKPIDVKIDVI